MKKFNLNCWQKSFLLIKTQGFLFIGLLPLMLILFQQVSLLAPLVNIIAIPFISLLVVPLCLAALILIWKLPVLAGILLSLADFLLSIFKQGLQIILSFSFSQQSLIKLPALNLPGFLLLCIGVVVLLYVPALSIRTKLFKVFSLSCFIPLFLPRHLELDYGEFTLDILDVGQGLALSISTSKHHLLYDTGPVYSPRFNAGSGVLLPFFRSKNFQSMDMIIVSHGDNDHSGGLAPLLASYPHAEYLSSDMSLFKADSNKAINASLCHKGQQWKWDGVLFQMLYPNDDNYLGNNSSCVLKISSGDYSVLLSGDIESRAERALLRNFGGEGETQHELKANILLP